MKDVMGNKNCVQGEKKEGKKTKLCSLINTMFANIINFTH